MLAPPCAITRAAKAPIRKQEWTRENSNTCTCDNRFRITQKWTMNMDSSIFNHVVYARITTNNKARLFGTYFLFCEPNAWSRDADFKQSHRQSMRTSIFLNIAHTSGDWAIFRWSTFTEAKSGCRRRGVFAVTQVAQTVLFTHIAKTGRVTRKIHSRSR